MLRAELAELVAQRNRLEAEFGDADAIAWEKWLLASAGSDATVRDILDSQQRLFEARRQSRSGQSAQLEERIKQTEQQIAGLEAQGDAVGRQIGHIGRELKAQRSLFEKNLTTMQPVLTLEREAARLDGTAGDITARIAAARGRIAELGLQILDIDTRRVEEAEGKAREARARENQVSEQLGGVDRRLQNMEVRAPTSGEVHEMRIFAAGEVVNPGEPILSIVPEGARLVVLAQLDPIHVDQLYAGQDAVLRFSSFPARSTPEYEGRVTRIGADVQHDPQTGIMWYEVELSLGSAIEPTGALDLGNWLETLSQSAASMLPETAAQKLREWAELGADSTGPRESEAEPEQLVSRDLKLSPGMPVEVYMRTEERTPLDYMAKPLTDYFMRSLRED